jgi:hypothetical protein
MNAVTKINEIEKQIISEIDKDIERGIYEMFPKLQERLRFIRRKLYAGQYIINSEELSKGELQTLIENDYLKKDEDIQN